MEGVSVIIPAYNEEKTIGEVVKVAKSSKLVSQVIVVSDGSTDQTEKEAEKAGADLVLKLPVRSGKGAALAHGVAHTDASVIVFLDADLLNLESEEITALALPVLEGKVAMNVALRPRGFLTRFLWYLPLISGERALLRQIFENIPDHFLQGFKVEIALNNYCRANHLPIGKIFFKKVKIVKKMQKFGFWRGLWEYLKMSWQVFKAMIETRLAWKTFQEKRLHEKHHH